MPRKPKYSQRLCDECEEFISEHGLIDYGGAKLKDYLSQMGFCEKAHRDWKKRYPEYAQAIERAKEKYKTIHSRKIFGTLMEAALGGERTVSDEHTEFRPNPQNPTEAIIRKQIRNTRTIYVAPNVVAGIFLLCNLDPEHFKNRQQNDITVKKNNDEDEMMTDAQIEAEISRLDKLQKK